MPLPIDGAANVAAGTYSITATATYNLGLMTTSAPVNVIVNAPPSAAVDGTGRWNYRDRTGERHAHGERDR